MSAVLRKKIEAGAGIPPSVMQSQQFWLQLQLCTRNWARETFGGAPDVSLAGRQTVNGKDAQAALDGETGFYFSADVSPGIAGLAIDAAGAVRNAAGRMKQDVASLTDASPLFLKLLAEQAGIALWKRTSDEVFGLSSAADAPLSDPSAATGGFDPGSRYMKIEYTVRLDGDATRVWYVCDFDFILQFARDSRRQAADQKALARHHSLKTLSDSVLASTLSLDAVLERLTLTIGECSQLEVGAVLPLTGADAGKLKLSANTIEGAVDIGSGALGVWKRQRALRLETRISERFAQRIADI